MTVKVEFFELRSGRAPVLEFLSGLSGKASDRVFREIELLEKIGIVEMMMLGKVKKLQDSLYELKVRFDNVFYRILFTVKGSVIWLLGGFKKKKNKTPNLHIKKAIERIKII